MSIDHHVGAGPIAECALGASGLAALLNAGRAVHQALRIGHVGGLHQESLPTVGRSLEVIGHAIAGCLADALQMLRPGLAPLVGVSGMGLAMLENAGPDFGRHHGGVTGSAEANRGTLENGPAVTDVRIASAPVAFPDGTGGLAPIDVAGSQIEPVVGAVAAVGAPGFSGEGLYRVHILPQDPSLEHLARLAIGRPIGETGDNANEWGAVDRAQALPQDATIQVWFGHRVLRAN